MQPCAFGWSRPLDTKCVTDCDRNPGAKCPSSDCQKSERIHKPAIDDSLPLQSNRSRALLMLGRGHFERECNLAEVKRAVNQSLTRFVIA